MTALVEDLLLLARLDAGRPVEQLPVDLTRVLLEAVSDARILGPDHGWRLELPAEPVEVTGDEQRLHQVVTNLLTNARKHTPAGTTVTVTVLPAVDGPAADGPAVDGPTVDGPTADGPRVDGPGVDRPAGQSWTEILVRDDGPGFPADLVGSAFERFTRADSSRSPWRRGRCRPRALPGRRHRHRTRGHGEPRRRGRCHTTVRSGCPSGSQATDRSHPRCSQRAPHSWRHGHRHLARPRSPARPRRRPRRPDPARPTYAGSAPASRRSSSRPPALPVGARRLGLGQLLLLRRRPGRLGVLAGVLLRLLGRRQLDHRRQDPAGPVADGPVGPGVRALVVEPAGAAGPGRRRRCGAAPRDGTTGDRLRSARVWSPAPCSR